MRFVIVGNGIAGVTVARTALQGDQNPDITLLSREPYAYYPRPRLIDLIAGDDDPSSIQQYPDDWYAKHGIRQVLGARVTRLAPEEHRVYLSDGSTEAYDVLVLATGAASWMPPVPGIDSPGVYGLRNMADALAIRQRAKQVRSAAIIGGGLLGLDLSVALRAHGLDVSVIELLPRLLPRQLDDAGAEILCHAMSERGVGVLTGHPCSHIRADGDGLTIALEDGPELRTDMIVVAVGVRPEVELAASAGIACGRGVLVDDHLATSAADVYAVGDVAEFDGRVWGIIPAAVAQARVLGRILAGDTGATYTDIVPSTTLKVTGIDLASLGEVNPADETAYTAVVRSDEHANRYCKLVLRQGHIVGAIVMGDRERVGPISQLINEDADVSGYEERLVADDFDLRAFVREHAKAHGS